MLIFFSSCENNIAEEYKLEGNVFGTSFHIVFISEEKIDVSIQIDSLFNEVNNSLSTYNADSDISRINRGDSTVTIDTYFEEVYHKSKKIHLETNGVFDPTIGVLVNAWGFGPEEKISNLNENNIQKLLKLVGYDKIRLKNGRIIKDDPQIYLDYNAIAKGYGIDVVSRFLEGKGIHNYMVEIGGEVRVRGVNAKNISWRVGIENPNFDGSRSLMQVVQLYDESMATSGNYRKFMTDPITGEKYVHTIDTKTGYTAKRNLLSASVIGRLDCADVDAYATAFMAMGLEKTKKFVSLHDELKVFLIYLDAKGEIQSYCNFDIE